MRLPRFPSDRFRLHPSPEAGPFSEPGRLAGADLPPNCYCTSLGGIRGGSSGVNDTSSPARGGRHQSPARRRGIAPSDGLDQAAFTGAEVGSTTALGAPGDNFADRLIGLFSERVPVRKPDSISDRVGDGSRWRAYAAFRRNWPTLSHTAETRK